MAKRPRKPKEEENKPGRYDSRNQLNDLTGKEWLLRTKSFWTTEPSVYDKSAYSHPAPFMVEDIAKLITMFTKRGMRVLDPFVGSGTTLIAAALNDRKSVGIDLNPDYSRMFEMRKGSIQDFEKWDEAQYIIGDSTKLIPSIGCVDYIVTSPPYHNILKNKSKGLRNNSGKLFRIGARDGVEYYSDEKSDLGNCESYQDFIEGLKSVFIDCLDVLRAGKYATIIMSDFTVDKKETFVQGDIVDLMIGLGFEYCGTTVLLQPEKPLYPFGYPYAYKINHHHQNMMTFRKPKEK